MVWSQSNQFCALRITNEYPVAISVQIESGDGRRIEVRSPDGKPLRSGASTVVQLLPSTYSASVRDTDHQLLFESDRFSLSAGEGEQELVCAENPAACSYDFNFSASGVDPNGSLEIKFSTPMFADPTLQCFALERVKGKERIPVDISWTDDRRSLLLKPRVTLFPDEEYAVRCLSLDAISNTGRSISERFEASFTTGHSTASIRPVEIVRSDWTGEDAVFSWDSVPGATGYIVSINGMKPVVVRACNYTVSFADYRGEETCSILIQPFMIVEDRRLFASKCVPIDFVVEPVRRAMLYRNYPVGGLTLGVCSSLGETCRLADPAGLDASFSVPLLGEPFGFCVGVRWSGYETGTGRLSDRQTVSASAGFRAGLPLRNFCLRLEPYAQLGYFAGTDLPEARLFHGPEASLGVRLDVRGYGVFSQANARFFGLYDGAPNVQLIFVAGLEWAFIPL
jgi:hypothetical protein